MKRIVIAIIVIVISASVAWMIHWVTYEDEIFKAIEDGDIARVKQMAKSTQHLNATARYGETPMMRALINGKLEAVKALADAGSDVNATDIISYSVINYAEMLLNTVGEHKTNIVEYLKGCGMSDEKAKQRADENAPSWVKTGDDIRALQATLEYLKNIKASRDGMSN